MNIVINANVPDSTYFTMSDVEPTIADGSLVVFEGKGSRRGWGSPTVTSTVVIDEPDFVAVHVGFHHKHRGGQGWFYFVNGQRAKWNQLGSRQGQVLEAAKAKAPSWAKAPGKLAAQRKSPTSNAVVGYKILAQVDGKLHSLYAPETTYELGKRMAQKAKEDHEGGFYAYHDLEALKKSWANGNVVGKSKLAHWQERNAQFVVVEVQAAGTIIEYGDPFYMAFLEAPIGKFAATYLTPVQVLEVLEATVNA
jgi:hypothetical protein